MPDNDHIGRYKKGTSLVYSGKKPAYPEEAHTEGDEH